MKASYDSVSVAIMPCTPWMKSLRGTENNDKTGTRYGIIGRSDKHRNCHDMLYTDQQAHATIWTTMKAARCVCVVATHHSLKCHSITTLAQARVSARWSSSVPSFTMCIQSTYHTSADCMSCKAGHNVHDIKAIHA